MCRVCVCVCVCVCARACARAHSQHGGSPVSRGSLALLSPGAGAWGALGVRLLLPIQPSFPSAPHRACHTLGTRQGALTLSSWKLGCREAWAGVCRTPSVPSRASPSHSELGVAILPERSGSAGRVSEAGRSIRGREGDPYLWAWLGLHPGHKDSPLEPRDAGGEDRATEQGGSLAPRRAAYVSYRHGLLQAGGLPPPAE